MASKNSCPQSPETSNSMLEAETALRAYHKWVARGRPSGTQLQDWLEAEAEVRRRRETVCPLTEGEKRLVVGYSVSRLLAMFDNLRDAASQLLQTVCECLGWDVGVLWMLDRKCNVLRCAEFWHSPRVEVPALERDARQRTFPPGVGLPGRVWTDEAPVWVPDIAAVTNLPRVAVEEGLHGAAGFPLHRGTEFCGVIEFFSREGRQPVEELIEMMTSIAIQINQFIDYTQVEDEIGERKTS
jgi:GAF domain-containing protein